MLVVAALLLALGGWWLAGRPGLPVGQSGPVADPGGQETPAQGASGRPSGEPSGQPGEPSEEPRDEALVWGPTEAELARARELAQDWSAEQLAGQVIVGRYHSTDPEEAAALVRDLHLAGVCVTSTNVVDAEQVLATTAAVSAAVAADGRDFPAVIGVDEEGGSVAHLRGVATTFPAFQVAGSAIDVDRAEGGRAGRQAVQGAARAAGLELRALGFTWVFAPVADVTIGAADPTIGSRSASEDPRTAATASAAAVRGYVEAGLVSTVKHFPGHGGATANSHVELPTLDASLEELRQRDLLPFKTSIRAGAPAVMVGHLAVSAIAPGVPATLAPDAYAYLREQMGFGGVTITDSLGMGAVVETPQLGVRALQAGADLLLMPADTARTHRTVTQAIESGELDRERVVDAAAQVVAVQLWQQRVAGQEPVPLDVTEQAQLAAAALEDAAY